MKRRQSYIGGMASAVAAAVTLSPVDTMADDPVRTFTTADGSKQMEATISSAIGDEVRIIRADSRAFTVKTTVFSKEDQEFIRKWKQEQWATDPSRRKNRQPRIDASVSASKKRDKGTVGDFDDITEKVTLKVKLENDERTASFRSLKGTVVVLGQSVLDSNVFKVFSTETHKFDLEVGKSASFECRPITTTFDRTAIASYGYAYDGWGLLVEDADANVILKKSTAALDDIPASRILNLRSGGYYERDFAAETEPVR